MAKIKLTPEQIKAQDESRAAAEANRQAEKAKAKQERRADLRAKHETLTAMALAWKKEGFAETNAVSQIKGDVAWRWFSAEKILREWQEEFVFSPADRFEWAETAVKAACERELLDTILWSAVRPDGAPLLDVIENIIKEVTCRYLSNYDRPSSTSAVHNATMIYKQEAVSNYVCGDGVFASWQRAIAKERKAATTVSTTTSPVN